MIDQQTVQQILDAADIVDVVSDFVSLKRRGANWVGLCPFHNDRNPSFYVSRAKGVCKCFSCGEGGSAVNFIMKHEQLSFPEALRWLANKYHIEIQEREVTDEERQAQSERESMLMVNEWACQFYEHQLRDTQQGAEVGLAYFNERGFNEASLKEFRLGYAPEQRDALYQAAIKKGYNHQLLFDAGLCLDDGHGGGYDRFRGRVIFPIMNLAGKVIAFGGRTLSHDKKVSKYINSPESAIYNKRNVLYGIYQAKRDIVSSNKCFIVEGYADVISMHQAGFKNVIASSGTALTEGHIHTIRRFTSNVTEMFDGDSAGIHAALRGVDMLLAEGFNIKVLQLPPEDDPDSFARSHNATQIQQFIDDNETDFIRFKSKILLGDAQGDPIKRSAAITDVVKSIALIPSNIARSVYAKECSMMFGIEEQVLLREIRKFIRQNREQNRKQKEREKLRQQNADNGTNAAPSDSPTTAPLGDEQSPDDTSRHSKWSDIATQERTVIRLVVKYGMCFLCDTNYDDGTIRPTSVVEYIDNQLKMDYMEFTQPLYRKIFDLSRQMLPQFYSDLEQFSFRMEDDKERDIALQMQQSGGENFDDMDSAAMIHAMERKQKAVEAKATAQMNKKLKEFRANYLERVLCSNPDDAIRQLACDMASEPYQLSKIHTQFANIVNEIDRLPQLVDAMLYNWKNALLQAQIKDVQAQIASADASQLPALMKKLQQFYDLRHKLSLQIGDRVISPE